MNGQYDTVFCPGTIHFHPAFCAMPTGSLFEGKSEGTGVDHSPISGSEVKEKVELNLCFPSASSWPVVG